MYSVFVGLHGNVHGFLKPALASDLVG